MREISVERIDPDTFTRARLGDSDKAVLEYQLRAASAIGARYSSHDFLGNPNVLTWLLGRPPTTFEQFVRNECAAQMGLERN